MYEKLHFDVGYFEGGHTIKENIPEFLRYYIFDTYGVEYLHFTIIFRQHLEANHLHLVRH